MEKLIIAKDSCNGETSEFEKWMNKVYPEIETSIENTLHGGYYVEGEYQQDNFWDEYCNS